MPKSAKKPVEIKTPADLPPLPRVSELLQLLPMEKSWLWQASRTGKFPRPIKLSERTTVWRREEVLEWLERKASVERGNS